MQLSNAMAMGRVLMKPKAGGASLMSLGTGCALEMAIAAEGKSGTVPWTFAYRLWPWLYKTDPAMNNNYLESVWKKFDIQVMGCDEDLRVRKLERMTFDQLIDWVRSVEPPEETATESSPVQIERAVSA